MGYDFRSKAAGPQSQVRGGRTAAPGGMIRLPQPARTAAPQPDSEVPAPSLPGHLTTAAAWTPPGPCRTASDSYAIPLPVGGPLRGPAGIRVRRPGAFQRPCRGLWADGAFVTKSFYHVPLTAKMSCTELVAATATCKDQSHAWMRAEKEAKAEQLLTY